MDIQLIRRDFNGDFKFSFALENETLTMDYSRMGSNELHVYSTDDYRPGQDLILITESMPFNTATALLAGVEDAKDHIYKVVSRDINTGVIKVVPPLRIDIPAGSTILNYGPRRSEIKVLVGIEAVMQHVVKLLLTSSGSDIFITTITDDIYAILRMKPSAMGEVMTRLTRYLAELQEFIIRGTSETAPDAERLSAIELTKVVYDQGMSRWRMWIRVRVVDGSTGTTAI